MILDIYPEVELLDSLLLLYLTFEKDLNILY